MENSDNIVLGGNIELSGFKEIDGSSLIVVKKIVGNYVKRISEKTPDFEKLHLVMKEVHKTPSSEKFELHAKATVAGKVITAEVTELNLFVAVDVALKKLESEMSK
jgi:ribosome-associated translation inhibitor RaiA